MKKTITHAAIIENVNDGNTPMYSIQIPQQKHIYVGYEVYCSLGDHILSTSKCPVLQLLGDVL